jgi:hypothetical protein
MGRRSCGGLGNLLSSRCCSADEYRFGNLYRFFCRVMVSETLGGLFVGQNLWAIWLLASAAITGLSLWLFTSFSDRFAGLMMFGLVVVLAQVVLIAVPLVLYVLIVLMSSPPRMAVGWQVPGLMLFGISLLQLLVISSVIVRGSG